MHTKSMFLSMPRQRSVELFTVTECHRWMSKLISEQEYFNVTQVPTAIVYKDGQEVKKVEGIDPAAMEEVAKILA